MSSRSAIVSEIRAGLEGLAVPADAPAMQQYMKSAMPFLGVRAPAVRRLCRTVFTSHRLEGRAEWEATVRELFDDATHREERYAALGLIGHRYYRSWLTAETLPLLQHVIATGAWWDLVDDASHRVGDVLRGDRVRAEPVIRSWQTHECLWLRRSSIICQLGHRASTDSALLTDAIAANLDDRDFFIRKAIGWALREYAKSQPAWVLDFVTTYDDRLSPLSKREALKHLA